MGGATTDAHWQHMTCWTAKRVAPCSMEAALAGFSRIALSLELPDSAGPEVGGRPRGKALSRPDGNGPALGTCVGLCQPQRLLLPSMLTHETPNQARCTVHSSDNAAHLHVPVILVPWVHHQEVV